MTFESVASPPYASVFSSVKSTIKTIYGGFPGGAVVENLPANAGDMGSNPGLGGSHMPRSNWAREPQLLSPRVWSLCSATRGRDSERPAHRDEEWPLLAATRESPRIETKTQHSQKIHSFIHSLILKKTIYDGRSEHQLDDRGYYGTAHFSVW